MIDEKFFMNTFFYPLFGLLTSICIIAVLVYCWKNRHLFIDQVKDLREYGRNKSIILKDQYETTFSNKQPLKEIKDQFSMTSSKQGNITKYQVINGG